MTENCNSVLPMIALRGISIFPGTVTTIEIERSPSIEAINSSGKKDRLVFLAAQKNPAVDFPQEKDLFRIGVVAKIRQQLMPHGGNPCRIMVEGLYRAAADSMTFDGKLWFAEISKLEEKKEKPAKEKQEIVKIMDDFFLSLRK